MNRFYRVLGKKNTVQEAIENVQSQVTEAIIGSIPSGSITGDKLAQDVRDRFTAIENTAKSEASTRANADTALNSRMSAAEAALTRKCEIQIGSYDAIGSTQTINLGYQPLAVFVTGGKSVYNIGCTEFIDLALVDMDGVYTSITANGFTVTNWMNYSTRFLSYRYIAFKPI